MNILAAQIHTRPDGIVFDVLHVTDTVMKPITDQVKFRIVKSELEKVVADELDVDELFASRKLSLPLGRRDRTAISVPSRVEIDNDVSEDHTVIDIYSTDRIGLLYLITSTLAALGLSIHTAKASTKVDQAVDVFYVKDAKGKKVTDPDAIERIRERLLSILEEEERETNFIFEETTTVEELVEALRTIGLETQMIIHIIKAIDRAGSLYGTLIVQ